MVLMFCADKIPSASYPEALEVCPDRLDFLTADQCLGTALMARMSFVLACFHLFVFIIILARNGPAAAFHDGCWGTKYALVGAGYVATIYWLPNGFVMGFYLTLTEWISVFFLIYQALLMLIVAYKVNDVLVHNFEAE